MSLKRKKRSQVWFIPPAEFTEIARTSKTITEMVNRCGLRNIGSNFLTVLKRVAEDKLDISHIPRGLGCRKGRVYGGNKPKPIEDILIENSSFSRSALKRRLLRDGLLENKCADCGLPPEWNGKSLVLRLDHINGVNNDNKIGNLRLLCPNCDSQSSTFTGRNNKGIHLHRCPDCSKKISKPSKKCRKCAGKDRVGVSYRGSVPPGVGGVCKVAWPPYEELRRQADETSYAAVAGKLGVSDTAVRRMLARMERRLNIVRVPKHLRPKLSREEGRCIRDKRRGQGLCTRLGCPRQAAPGKAHCQPCIDGEKRRYDKRKEMGRCVTCQNMAVEGSVFCQNCLDRRVQKYSTRKV